MTIEIPLTRGKVALISDHQLERVSRHNWCALRTVSGDWYAVGRINGKVVYLHSFIMDTPAGMEVDHINGDTLNCTDDNMRLCTHIQNMHNKKKRSNNKSGYIGVHWNKHAKKWIPQIKVDGRSIHLGTFENIIDAARTRDAAAIKYYGEFARLNFPTGEQHA